MRASLGWHGGVAGLCSCPRPWGSRFLSLPSTCSHQVPGLVAPSSFFAASGVSL